MPKNFLENNTDSLLIGVMKTKILSLFTTLVICFGAVYVGADMEYYDGVAAVVNGIPVVYSDVQRKFEHVKNKENIPQRRHNYEFSRVLDSFIADALVYEVAQRESLIVSDERVANQLEPVIQQFASGKTSSEEELNTMVEGIKSGLVTRAAGGQAPRRLRPLVDEFIEMVEKEENREFVDLFQDLRSDIKKELVMSVSVGVNPPSREEARRWYERNKDKVGLEVRVKHILIRPEGSSLSAQREASSKLNELRRRAQAGESFDSLARTYSQDRSTAARGGDTGWVELHRLDPYFANHVYQLQRIGQISEVFTSNDGYHIAKLEGRRTTSFERVERMIMYKLYQESVEKQFQEWVAGRKTQAEIEIFVDNYVEAR